MIKSASNGHGHNGQQLSIERNSLRTINFNSEKESISSDDEGREVIVIKSQACKDGDQKNDKKKKTPKKGKSENNIKLDKKTLKNKNISKTPSRIELN